MIDLRHSRSGAAHRAMRRRGIRPIIESMANTSDNSGQNDKRATTFLEVGIWLLFFALLIPAGVVGYVIGHGA
jgi:hypothetical protein